MRPIPKLKLREWLAKPVNQGCARQSPECSGRLTIEHALLLRGRQMDEPWTWVRLCWFHHLGPGLDKRENERIALSRISDAELEARFPRTDWLRRKRYLCRKRY